MAAPPQAEAAAAAAAAAVATSAAPAAEAAEAAALAAGAAEPAPAAAPAAAPAPPSAASRQMPGAEFMLSRLARATAIPAAERPPDVAAFVESVRLLHEACDLLPLTADGEATLPPGCPQSHWQLAHALYRVAKAIYMCPCQPECDRPNVKHVDAYACRWAGVEKKYVGESTLLEQVLGKAVLSRQVGDNPVFSVKVAGYAAQTIANPSTRQRLNTQLQHMAAQVVDDAPPLSLDPLHFLVSHTAAKAADDLRVMHNYHQSLLSHLVRLPPASSAMFPFTSPDQVEAMRKAGQASLATMQQLEPSSPEACRRAGEMAAFEGQTDEAGRLYLKAVQLARQQRQDWMLVHTAQRALMFFAGIAAGENPAEPSSASASSSVFTSSNASASSRPVREAAVAVYQQAQQALRRCKPVLPQAWILALELKMQVFDMARREVEGFLQEQHLHQRPSHIGMDVSDIQRTADAALLQCNACGLRVVGLRRCSRCKKAQYCSTECQHQHWRVHKRDCQPA